MMKTSQVQRLCGRRMVEGSGHPFVAKCFMRLAASFSRLQLAGMGKRNGQTHTHTHGRSRTQDYIVYKSPIREKAAGPASGLNTSRPTFPFFPAFIVPSLWLASHGDEEVRKKKHKKRLPRLSSV